MRRHRIVLVVVTVLLVSVAGAVLMAQRMAQRDPDPSPSATLQRPSEETSSFPSLNKDLPIEESEVVLHGSLRQTLYIDFTDAELREINREVPRFLNRITLLGWQREGNRLSRTVPARDLTLHLGEERIQVTDGRYALLAEEADATEQRRELRRLLEEREEKGTAPNANGPFPFRVSLRGAELPAGAFALANVDLGVDESSPLRADIVQNIEFRAMRAKMHGGHVAHGKATGNATSPPMDTRCMDYNGPASNGENYPITHWRAYVNFVCSDCDLAGISGRCVNCWSEILKPGCLKNHGKLCSTKIGHSTSYHKHKWSACKICG